jgi:hypothetical protein
MAILLTARNMMSATSLSDAMTRAELIRGIEQGLVDIDPELEGVRPEDGAEHYIIRMADLYHGYVVEVVSFQVAETSGFQFNRLYMDGFRLGDDAFGMPVVRAIHEHTNMFDGM